MPQTKLQINRAPVLTLWAAVVAERLGYSRDEALTLAKAVAGLNAQSKGRRLGIYEEGKEEGEDKQAKAKKEQKVEFVPLLGRGIPAVRTPKGLRASIQGETIEPQGVERYLHQKFGDRLEEARTVMEELARSFTPRQLESQAYPLYEKFRPEIPEGKKGWGAKGELDLDYILSLVK